MCANFINYIQFNYTRLKNILFFVIVHSVMAAAAQQGDPKTAKSIYEFTVNDIKGNPISLEQYRGHAMIIVNVASKCGYAAEHYKELNAMYDELGESKGKCGKKTHFEEDTMTLRHLHLFWVVCFIYGVFCSSSELNVGFGV